MKAKTRFFSLILSFNIISAVSEKNTHTDRGEKSFAAANYADAMKHFKNAIKAGENRGEPYFFIGTILENRRNYSKSIPFFMQSVKRYMKDEYKKAALWKLVLYFNKVKDYSNVIKYVQKLNKAGVYYKQLKKIKAEARSWLTPARKEAREIIAKVNQLAIEIDLTNNESKPAGNSYWFSNKEKIEKIVNSYYRAATVDQAFAGNLLRAARLSEKIKDYQVSERIYRKLTSSNQNGLLLYKLAVSQKKLGNFQSAISNFKKALEKLKASNKQLLIKFYIYTSLAQCNYALEQLKNARIYALKALEIQKKSKNLKTKQIPRLLYCNSQFSLNSQEFREAVPRIIEKNCLVLLHKNYKSLIRAKEIKFFWLFQSKLAYFDSKTNQETIQPEKMRYFALAYLAPEVLHSNEIDQDQSPALPNWALVEKKYANQIIEASGQCKLMIAFSDNDTAQITESLRSKAIQCHLKNEDHEKVEIILMSQKSRRYEEEKQLILVRAKLKKYAAIQKQVLTLIEAKPSMKEALLSYIKAKTELIRFRDSDDYKILLEKTEAIEENSE